MFYNSVLQHIKQILHTYFQNNSCKNELKLAKIHFLLTKNVGKNRSNDLCVRELEFGVYSIILYLCIVKMKRKSRPPQ